MAIINIGFALIRSDLLASDNSHVQYQKIMDGTVGSETVAKVTAFGLQTDRSKKPLTAVAPANYAVAVAGGQIVGANANRTGMDFRNISTTRICLGFGAAAVMDKGIVLDPGDSWSMAEFGFSQAAIFAIAKDIDGAVLAVQEWQ